MVFVKPNKFLPFIKSSIDQCGSTFIYALLSLVNNQSQSKIKHLIRNIHTRSNDNFLGSEKLTKALFDPLIFTNRKNLSINQELFKMQSKFEIN